MTKPGKKPFESKICPACGIDKPRAEYYKKGETVSYRCKPCTLIQLKKDGPKYFGKYADYQNQWRRNKYINDPAYRDKISEQKKIARESNLEAIKQARRNRWANDPYDPARLYYRRKDVNVRTPSWVSKKALLEIYANCPKGLEVDHIIPLKGLIDGRPVSGLHVPWNLQYLTKEANRKKYNRVSESDL